VDTARRPPTLARAVRAAFPMFDAFQADPLSPGASLLLALALAIALGFEFVNGFHDTANAVATVI
jgi:hypothetical protein